MVKKGQSDAEMLKGTLDMMILRTLVTGDAHGHTIAKVIERTSEDVLEVEQGSLYPALHRLEDRGWVSSYWGASENNRKAKFYRLTAAGKKQLVRERNRWRQMARAIALVMGEEALTNGGVE
jgi:PadR family transcriptional regulator PadR